MPTIHYIILDNKPKFPSKQQRPRYIHTLFRRFLIFYQSPDVIKHEKQNTIAANKLKDKKKKKQNRSKLGRKV